MKKTSRADADRFCELALRNSAFANFFGSAEALYGYADNGDLYMRESGAGAFLFAEAGGFFRLYFALTDAESAPPVFPNATVVTEIAFRGGKLPHAAEYFLRNGFVQVLTRSRMSLNGPGGPPAEESAGFADPEAVLDLFRHNFDRYTGCVPTLAELERASAEGRIITAAGKGALFYENAGAASILRNVAVAPEVRGRGLGDMMLKAWISRCVAARKPVLRLWVADGNAPAVNLYKKHGFKPDGLKSVVLKKE